MKKTLYKIGNIFYASVVLAVVAFTFLFLGTRIDFLGYQVKVVKSGSMEPAVAVGSIVVIAPNNAYNVGDIVTFGKSTNGSIPVTHRIIEKIGEGRSTSFVTKGDANQNKDPRVITERSIIGKVAFTVPGVGYLIEFARTKLGFVLLIGVPALIIALDELANITWEIHKHRYKKRREDKSKKPNTAHKNTVPEKNSQSPVKVSTSVNKQYI